MISLRGKFGCVAARAVAGAEGAPAALAKGIEAFGAGGGFDTGVLTGAVLIWVSDKGDFVGTMAGVADVAGGARGAVATGGGVVDMVGPLGREGALVSMLGAATDSVAGSG